MLYGAVPFPGKSLADIRAAIERQVPHRPETSDVPDSVAEVLLRALRVSPSTRYPSMKQLLSRLEAVG